MFPPPTSSSSSRQETLDAIDILRSYFPPDASRAVKIATHFIELNECEKALMELEPYLDENATAQLTKAKLLIKTESWEEAWTWLQKIIKNASTTQDEESANAVAEALYQSGRILEDLRYEPAGKEHDDTDNAAYISLGAGNARFKFEEQARQMRMLKSAINMFTEGATKYGHGMCFYQLGKLHLQGVMPKSQFTPIGPQKTDHDIAFEYFSKAAEKNSAEALFQLARLWEIGRGAPKKSRARAAECYERSARLGNEAAMFQIGLCYMEGRGVKRSSDRALHYLKQAKLHKAAITTKGLLYLEKKDYLAALSAFREGAQLKSSKSLYNLGCLYRRGTPYTPQNIQKAKVFLRQAASLGNAHAMVDLGVFAIQEENFVEAFRLFQSARERGSQKVLLNLAQMYAAGEGTKKDEEKAIALLEEAINRQHGSSSIETTARERLEELRKKRSIQRSP